jgi:hypothetical protein
MTPAIDAGEHDFVSFFIREKFRVKPNLRQMAEGSISAIAFAFASGIAAEMGLRPTIEYGQNKPVGVAGQVGKKFRAVDRIAKRYTRPMGLLAAVGLAQVTNAAYAASQEKMLDGVADQTAEGPGGSGPGGAELSGPDGEPEGLQHAAVQHDDGLSGGAGRDDPPDGGE